MNLYVDTDILVGSSGVLYNSTGKVPSVAWGLKKT